MNPIVKRILAAVLGAATAIAITFICEMINSNFYHPPAGFDPKNMDEVKAMMLSMPNGAYVLVIVGYILGSFFGGLVASLISGREKANSALIVGVIVLIGGCLNLVMLPGQPMWFMITSTLIYVPFAYFGHLSVKKKN